MDEAEGTAFWRGPLATAYPALPKLRSLLIKSGWDTSGGTAGGISRNTDGSVTVTLDASVATLPVLVHEAGHAIEGDRARTPRERDRYMTIRGFPTWDSQVARQFEEQKVQPPRFAPNGPRMVWHISPNEKYAEGFRLSAQISGLVPFDDGFYGRTELTETYGLAFPFAGCDAYFRALKGDDMAKFISGDLAVATDASGNASQLISVTGLEAGVPAFGIAQRIGLTGSEASLPVATFQIDLGSAAFGRLHVRNDPVKSGTTFWRVCGIQ